MTAKQPLESRELAAIIPAVAASDGAGVKLRRSLGSGQNLRHEDNHGNRGDLGPGDVQWMTAARGIIHSEMPQQTSGRMRGFQLWLNLPAAEKMNPASYRDITANEIPRVKLPGIGAAGVIAGTFEHSGTSTPGPISGVTTQPFYFDIHLDPDAELQTPLPATHHALLYVYEGEAAVGRAARALPFRSAGILGDGAGVTLRAGKDGTRLLLLAGLPLPEPVVQYGPFVMNTREQIEQAVADYQRGEFGRQRAASGGG